MGNFLYWLTAALLVVWGIGFFGYHSDGFIHVLLVLALITLLVKVIGRDKV